MHTQIVEYLNFKLTRSLADLFLSSTSFSVFSFSVFFVCCQPLLCCLFVRHYKLPVILFEAPFAGLIDKRTLARAPSLSLCICAHIKMHTINDFRLFSGRIFSLALAHFLFMYTNTDRVFFSVSFKLFILKFFYSICNAISKSQLLYAP